MRHTRLAFATLLALLGAALADVTVHGRVVDAETGQPVAGANVVAGTRATTTDADGAFRLAGVAADSIAVSHVGYRSMTVAAAGLVGVALSAAPVSVAPVVVHAGLTEEPLSRATQSVTVIAGDELRAGGGIHLQDVAAAIPNLNWAGGTARPQYFQLRGIGERSRYAGEGPPSFSVGSVVDDVDLSGLATGGLLFDVGQVEVYRGPQSTVFGANAMAGLIHARSRDPEPGRDLGLTAQLGGDGLAEVEGFANLPLGDDLALRAGYATSRSDGFRHNEYLDRHDTNRRREGVARAKLRWMPPSGARVVATAFRTLVHDGYDAWAPDNNADLVTYADSAGVDRQGTAALSLRAEVPVTAAGRLVSVSAYAETDAEYSFDGDWGNDAFWRQAPYGHDPEVEGWRYAFFDHMRRDRRTWTQELRWVHAELPAVGGEGVVGAFAKGLEETTDATGYLFGGDGTELASTFAIDELAPYGQLVRQLSARTRLTANLRADRSTTSYRGTTVLSDGTDTTVAFDAETWLPGGRVAVDVALGGARTAFVAASRGYRAGGVNQHPRLADANRPYDPEYLWSLEAGARHTGARAQLALTLFHGRRSSQQVELSTQQDPGDPNSFVYFTNNAGSGWNAGAELEGSWRAAPALQLALAVGLLATHVDAYTFLTGQGETLTLGDREAAHAPGYNLRAAVDWGRDRGPCARLEVTAKDGFYFSDSHDQRSDAYGLVHGNAGWRGAGWRLQLWGRNLLDERYPVRGFYFGLEPPDYADKLYVSYGEPRQVGVTLTADILDVFGALR